MDMSKVNMHKKMAMTGHYRGGGIAKRGKGKALANGGLSDAEGRALGRRTADARGRALRKFGAGKAKRRKKGPHQGYKAREDESLGMRTGKESGKKQSMKSRRDESYGDWGKRKSGKINKKRGGHIRNTSRENRLEELGRVDAEKAYTRKGKRNLGAEKRRVVRELNK